jgi:adenine-specific DNA-methyltransferase
MAPRAEQLSVFDVDGPAPTSAGLLALAGALGAGAVGGWTALESRRFGTSSALEPISKSKLTEFRRRICAGHDPLGDAFSRMRSAEERRPLGATYTPLPIVMLMLDWAEEQARAMRTAPARVVDPGTGSARFLVSAGRRFPNATLLGIEIDPIAAALARAHLAAAGMAHRAEIVLGDYRSTQIPGVEGATLYIGNPPYVRHHQISLEWKAWLVQRAEKLGLAASQLAGLHVHFYLATALKARAGDFGTFITAAEWLDVNYGRLVRELFLGDLGGSDLLVLEPTVRAFPDAASTAAISTFVVGDQPKTIRLSRAQDIETIGRIGDGRPVKRDRLVSEARWSRLTRPSRAVRENFVELGELCRVHRGSVTGANRVWIAGEHSAELPSAVRYASVTRARELFSAGAVLDAATHLRDVIDLPADLDEFEGPERRSINNFLRKARSLGAHLGYVARHRKPWWSVGLREAPPIMATYMARRPPAFVRNKAGARYINIAHGLYPREALGERMLRRLAAFLSTATSIHDGRTYAGGLTKFEPREMERLLVPGPSLLASGDYQ